jgi:hypothetical protein
MLLMAATLAVAAAVSEQPRPFEAGIEFPAADTRDRIDYPLGRDLVVRARRQFSSGRRPMGWSIQAVDRRLADSPNFLFDCRCGHGAHPTDLLAWHLLDPEAASVIGPLTERILPVWGYPYELRVRCIGCEGEGDDVLSAHFVKGTIQVGWRRLAESNPRQRGPSEFPP